MEISEGEGLMRMRLLVLVAGLSMPAVLLAQHKPKEGGRVAGIAAPEQAAATPVTPVTVPPPGQFLYGSVPVLVTPDGRVFADFGSGYEQLVRNCATPLANYQPAQQPPSVTQPVPNQPTASAQMAQRGAQPSSLPRATTVNSQSCWSTDTRGKVMVGK
jgi:hypothetical protein